MRFFAFCCRGDLQIAHIDGRALIINIEIVRKGLFLVCELQIEWTIYKSSGRIAKLNGRFANQVGELKNWMDDLQIKWANCKLNGRFANWVGELKNWMGELKNEWANWKLNGRIANWMGDLQIKWANCITYSAAPARGLCPYRRTQNNCLSMK